MFKSTVWNIQTKIWNKNLLGTPSLIEPEMSENAEAVDG